MEQILYDKVFHRPATETEIDRLIHRGQLFINKHVFCESDPNGRVWVALRDDVKDFELRDVEEDE